MPFVCKPSGGYSEGSADWNNNADMIYSILNAAGWSDYAVAAVIGNLNMESGLNPWRWEDDRVRLDGFGYGLPQFTSAREYIELSGYPDHAPNMSTSGISGGNVSDGIAQTNIIRDNSPIAKWTGVTWRSYWSTALYPSAWARCQQLRNKYGKNNFTYSEFQHDIQDVNDATYLFFSAYEGPGNADYYDRYEAAGRRAYQYITGHEPPEPPGPGPGPEPGAGLAAWFGVFNVLKKRRDNGIVYKKKGGVIR